MRRQRSRSAAALLLALVLCTCTDAPTGPRRVVGRLALAPVYSREAREIARNLSAADLPLDKVFVEVRDEGGTVRASQLVDFPASQNQITISLEVPLTAQEEQLAAKVELRSGDVPIFESVTTVTVKQTETTSTPTEPLKYVGPGADATVLKTEPERATIALNGSQQLATAAFDAKGSPVSGLPITSWTSTDETIATVTTDGLVKAGQKSGTATITARALNTLTASTSVHVVGLPSRIAITGGDGQTGIVGTTMTQVLQIQVLSSDGEGVPGVAVSFQSVTPGGAVAPASGTTDGHGLAATTISLGTASGVYVFKASVVGAGGPTPATTTATAIAGAAAAITRVSGDGQSGAAGALLAAPLVVRVADSFGNAVGGAAVTWTRLTGSGAIGTPTVTTGANGLASTSYTLGTTLGDETVRADVNGLTGVAVTFDLTSNAGVPSTLALVSGDQQSTTLQTTLSQPFVVRAMDALGNPASGVAITWTRLSGPGDVRPLSATTGSDGTASAQYAFGTVAGTATVRAEVSGVAGADVTFTCRAVSGLPIKIVVVAGANQSARVGTLVPVAPIVQVLDQYGNSIAGQTVNFNLGTGGGRIIGAIEKVTDADGRAGIDGWQLGPLPGDNTIAVAAEAIVIVMHATATVGEAASIAAAANVPLQSTVQAGNSIAFADLPSVVVRDAAGSVVPGASVSFSVAGGTIVTPNGAGPPNPTIATSDANGQVTLMAWTPPTSAGTYTVTATLVGTASAVTFSARVMAATPAALTAISDNQFALIGVPLAMPPSVRVADRYDNSIAGVAVQFVVASGGGGVAGGSQVTGGNGIATVGGWTLGPTVGAQSLNVTAAGLTTTIHATGTAPSVSFTAATQRVSESVGTAKVTVQLSTAPALPVTVPFTVAGTAASPNDYSLSASPLTIPAGSTSGTVTVTVVNDAIAESDETVVVTLGTPTNGTLSGTTTYTLTIGDDDETLSILFAGRGSGSVASSNVTPAINCASGNPPSGNCGATYPLGTQVSLTATPQPTGEGIFHFENWIGTGSGFTCTTNATCLVTMAQARDVTALFSVPGAITYKPSTVSFSMVRGGALPQPMTVSAVNTGERPLQLSSTIPITYAPSVTPWLSAKLDKLTIDTLSPANLTLEALPDTLPAGTYQANVILRDSGLQFSWSLVVTLTISPGPTAPVISKIIENVIAVKDSRLCPSFNGSPIGTSFQIDFDYADVNGDGPTNLPEASLSLSWLFTPQGDPGGFNNYTYQSSLTGDGSTGHATTKQCYYFGTNTSITVSMTIVDKTGLRSSATDPNAKVSFPKPLGSN